MQAMANFYVGQFTTHLKVQLRYQLCAQPGSPLQHVYYRIAYTRKTVSRKVPRTSKYSSVTSCVLVEGGEQL